MPPKRKRPARGLAAGERLKRHKLSEDSQSSPWGWVGTQASDASEITLQHLLATCSFSGTKYPLCVNRYMHKAAPDKLSGPTPKEHVNGGLEDDVIVISDDDENHQCDKKSCKSNPNCLNYLGQEKWEDEDDARNMFMKIADIGSDPGLDARDADLPVGLKNLGATCYANAFLQVWFQDLAFRSGVYRCQPSSDNEETFKESPVFQLQVTFAALQESTKNVYNPSKLVESLQLRTTEQQDAQEFSKLFMSHLDNEFQKQSIPSLKSLIADQFQGKQVYGTICNNCHNRSERDTDFLEVEINFETGSKLEDRIAALLQPEFLSGDNQYLCSHCDSLQDATRYTEFRKLPPVLHFSLLRFVYDISSMERKKSKHIISFPKTLNMTPFLGSGSESHSKDENVYELRGILLHKGSSAYHGHYEAQVFDVTTQTWFRFDDEDVSKIKTLGDKRESRREDGKVIIEIDDEDDNQACGSKENKQRANARKRRRVDDSGDEIVVDKEKPRDGEITSEILSKDAYMLVYARKGAAFQSSQTQTFPHLLNDYSNNMLVPKPPDRALCVVNALNTSHDEECDRYAEREKKLRYRFEQTRRRVMNIYRSWSVPSGDENQIVVSQSALEAWLHKYSIEASLTTSSLRCAAGKSLRAASIDTLPVEGCTPKPESCHQRQIMVEDILCVHGRLDPQKAGLMKLINQSTCEIIRADTNCSFHPQLTPNDVCSHCVGEIFKERLYQIEHPRLVHRFDELNDFRENLGYWISKQWLKDWRLVKPKMHVVSKGDPPPDSPEFDIRCEHGGLSFNTIARRQISVEACELLTSLYPAWEPMATETVPCSICNALVLMSKEDKLGLRKKAEDEKAKLKHMYDHALTGDTMLLEGTPCAVVPTNFVRCWRQWLVRPTETFRPDIVDTTTFICEHSMLIFDPNVPSDMDTTISLIRRSDWDVLEGLYSCGPLISIERLNTEIDKFVTDIEVCNLCRLIRRSDYHETTITVRLARRKDPANPSDIPSTSSGTSTGKSAKTYGSRNIGNLRQSKRLRQVKEHGERRKLTVTKFTTVKDIKVMLQEELGIPTICQRLLYRGQDVGDNAATVKSLGILANDMLVLQEIIEDADIVSDSGEEPTKRKKPREEERGFGGTLLGQSFNSVPLATPTKDSKSPSITTSREPSAPLNPTGRPCSICTFSNVADALSCAMCDHSFI